jgi:predicted transcriptional regulator
MVPVVLRTGNKFATHLVYRDKQEWYVAGQKRLARMTGLSKDEVSAAIKWLTKMGILIVKNYVTRDNFKRRQSTAHVSVDFEVLDVIVNQVNEEIVSEVH